jgi:hypothetical protein
MATVITANITNALSLTSLGTSLQCVRMSIRFDGRPVSAST